MTSLLYVVAIGRNRKSMNLQTECWLSAKKSLRTCFWMQDRNVCGLPVRKVPCRAEKQKK